MKKLLLECNGHYLFENNDHFWVTDDKTGEWFMVNMHGTKKDIIDELKRWSVEVDMNNSLMLEMENKFINLLESL